MSLKNRINSSGVNKINVLTNLRDFPYFYIIFLPSKGHVYSIYTRYRPVVVSSFCLARTSEDTSRRLIEIDNFRIGLENGVE